MSILVCGGAGYIGSHAVRALLDRGESAVVVDNLWTGHRQAVPAGVSFYDGDIRDAVLLDRIFSENTIEAVMHFAACSQVGESVQKPLKYFNNNVYGMQVLLESMARNGVKKIVFSSSASVYGEPKRVPIVETDPLNPTSPYGETKRIMEQMIRWTSPVEGIGYVSLRYFNVAGAAEDGTIGEDHRPETHLVPIILQVPNGQRSQLTVFGNNYLTPDGTCVRDYVQVMDLANAHIRALDWLRAGGTSEVFNLGSGDGYSVRQMIEAAENVTGTKIRVVIGPRRSGDPARLVACCDKAEKMLGWKPEYRSMNDIIATAWKWHKSHPNGYGED